MTRKRNAFVTIIFVLLVGVGTLHPITSAGEAISPPAPTTVTTEALVPSTSTSVESTTAPTLPPTTLAPTTALAPAVAPQAPETTIPATIPATVPPTIPEPSSGQYGWPWDQLVQCEAGGNWHINTGNGYSGGLQWLHSTWVANGGQEFAAEAWMASAEQQIIVAQRLVAASGGTYGAWPGCRAHLGLP